MIILLWLLVIMVFLYTMGFALSLWKNKNKIGAIAVFFLAVFAIVLPYLTYFKT
jgi:hypothetical protein